jgi:hypothetical protein
MCFAKKVGPIARKALPTPLSPWVVWTIEVLHWFGLGRLVLGIRLGEDV